MFICKKTQSFGEVKSLQIKYRFKAILIKLQATFSAETDKLTQKFVWKCQEYKIAETI